MTVTAPPLIAQVVDDLAGRESAPVGALSERLVADGADVLVVGSAESNRRQGITVDPRVRFVPVEMSARRRSFAGSWMLRAIREVRLAIAGADLVHAHGRVAGMLAAVATGKRVPLVVSWYRWNPTSSVGGGHGRLRKHGPAPGMVARRATVNCAGSSMGLQRLRSAGASDARLVPPPRPSGPIDLDRPGLREGLGAADRPMVVVTAEKRRRAHQLVAELSTLLRTTAPRPVVIGPEQASTAAPAADVLVTLTDADTVLARRALAAGVPLVVAGDIRDGSDPAAPEAELAAIAHDAALYTTGQPPAIASAVERLLQDTVLARRLTVAAERQVAGWPDEQDTVAQLVAIYRELLPG